MFNFMICAVCVILICSCSLTIASYDDPVGNGLLDQRRQIEGLKQDLVEYMKHGPGRYMRQRKMHVRQSISGSVSNSPHVKYRELESTLSRGAGSLNIASPTKDVSEENTKIMASADTADTDEDINCATDNGGLIGFGGLLVSL